MIKAKNSIRGRVNISQKIEGKLNASIVKEYPELEDIEIMPSGEEQNYIGSYRNVKVNPVTADIDTDIIPENIKSGVNILGVDGSYEGTDTSDATATAEDIIMDKTAYVNGQKITGVIYPVYDTYYNTLAKEIDVGDRDVIASSSSGKGYYSVHNTDINMIIPFNDLANAIELTGDKIVEGNTIIGVEGTRKVGIDTSGGEEFKITNCAYLFYKGARTEQLNEILKHCKDYENANYMFDSCTNLLSEDIDFTLLDFNKVTSLQYTFNNCSKLETIDLSHFKNNTLKYLVMTFQGCSALKNLDLSGFEMDKLESISSPFPSSLNLTELRGFKNLGKGYTRKTSNYASYALKLSHLTQLTYESLINIINNLYDLNLTYDVANGGTLYRQTLDLGATNLAKLTEEEIAIATNKGWNVT